MLRNIGGTERFFRIALGIGLLTLVFFGPHTALGYVGLIPLLTGLFGYCPLYHVLGRRPTAQ